MQSSAWLRVKQFGKVSSAQKTALKMAFNALVIPATAIWIQMAR